MSRFDIQLVDSDYNDLLKPGQWKVTIKDGLRSIGDSPHVVTSIDQAMRAAESDILEYLAVEAQNERQMPWPVPEQ